MARCLKVHADHINPRVDERFNELVGILDHEVGIKGQISAAAELRHNRGPEGDVGNEMPVHDIEVDDVRSAPVHLGDLLAQTTEVGGKKGGGDGYVVRIENHKYLTCSFQNPESRIQEPGT